MKATEIMKGCAKDVITSAAARLQAEPLIVRTIQNSKLNTFLLIMVACKDSHSNLKKVPKPYKKQIKDLQNTQWQGKQIRVFLFGDYDFLLNIYGTSGAQTVHPRLRCTASKQQTQRSATQQPDLPKRSLDSIRKDRQRCRLHGKNDIKKAKAYNNAIHDPLFDVPLTQVAPPYLHILLGISKKHHDILEKDCHALDKQTGVRRQWKEICQQNTVWKNLSTNFRTWNKTLKKKKWKWAQSVQS